tara:strand:+ start:309 stop:824 length:516 start_codon:yes stop_codon:yes gene_type:complete
MSTIYRYKFSTDVLEELKKFASTHRYDEVEIFRESWEEWANNNIDLITRENRRLFQLGYTGDIKNKMYKSVRYYFKNKPLKNIEEKQKRKKYISVGKSIIKMIDQHIDNNGKTLKPSEAYESFINSTTNEQYKDTIDREKSRLSNLGIRKEEIIAKFKKTYKNRYFIKQHR